MDIIFYNDFLDDKYNFNYYLTREYLVLVLCINACLIEFKL